MAKRQNKKTEQIDPSQLDTYFKKRMHEMGIVDTSDHFFKVEPEYPFKAYNQPIFAEHEASGNIVIHYPSLYGGAELIAGTENEFKRIRFKPDNQPEPDRKYFQEPKSGVHIFHTQQVIEKFAAKTKIETLYVVEGEFKAFAGALQGLDIVGLGGKDLFLDSDKKSLHDDLIKIIHACDVTNLVLLLDADVELVTWDHEEEPNKDLAKRLYSFYNTVVRFREVAKSLVKDVYFLHIKDDYVEETKGLDDLLCDARAKGGDTVQKVIADLQRLTGARVWFNGHNLTSLTPTKLKNIFRLNIVKGVPSSFYFWYENLIGEKEFTFSGARYKKSSKGEGLELVRHEDSFKFIRVGCDYIKIIHVPDAKGVLRRKLKGWKSGEISRDYVNNGFKNFYETLEKYDEFCNVPCNTDAYQPVVNGCYNMYYKLDHVLEPGSWSTIEMFLKHIFGEAALSSGHTNYELALDYLTIIYRYPTQPLPIPCLVSRDRGTGKSTFLWFQKDLWQENATFISPEDLKDQFNDDWCSKLFIGIDEGFIDKKSTLEKVKSMSTAPSIKYRGLYQAKQEIPFFGKFGLSSNDEENFIAIDDLENRFWVNKVPKFKEDDPLIREKMQEEVPAFLHYLSNREILHPRKSRHWFDPMLLETEALKRVRQNSKGWAYSELTVILQSRFLHYKYHTLFYTLEEISALINKPGAAVKYRDADIFKQLKEKFNLKSKMLRREFPVEPDHLGMGLPTMLKKHGRLYEFRVENFFTEEDLREEFNEFFDYEAIIASRSDVHEVLEDQQAF